MKAIFLLLAIIYLASEIQCASPPVYPDNCFFSVQKDSSGTWWIVDPNGKTFWSKGIDVIHPSGDTDKVTGKQPYYQAVLAKYGNTSNWANAVVERLLEWNINTLGAWTSTLFYTRPMPFTLVLNVMTSWATVSCSSCYIPDLYDPGFVENTKKLARTLVLPRASNPYFLGYFLDNEIYMGPDWHLNTPLFSYYINFTTNSAGWQTAIAWAQKLYPSIASINKAWDLNLENWGDLHNIRIPTTSAYVSDSPLFDRQTANYYFNTSCHIIRSVDPNHLILGIKYDGFPSEQVILADAQYGSDILSIDWYQWPAATYGSITTLYNLGNKPVLFGEFAYRGNDTGLPNTKGAGPVVATQQLRALMYTEFMRNMSKLPYTVGALWFEWVDEPINGRAGDGENSNYGVVNVNDDVYTDLTNAMAEINPGLDILHGATRELPAQCRPLHVCPNGCSGNGCCNEQTGRCVCSSYFAGGDCSIPAGYLDENFSPSDNLANWAIANGNWGNYYTYYRSSHAYSLSNSGITLYLNSTGCPAACGNSAYAGSGLLSAYPYANGWLNLTLQGSPVENADILVQWINTDATGATDGYQYSLNQTGASLFSVYDSVLNYIGEVGFKFNQSTGFHTYSLFWGSNNQMKFAIDGTVLVEKNIIHKYNNGNINIHFLAQEQLAKNIDLTKATIRSVVYETEVGYVPARCSSSIAQQKASLN